MAKKPLTPKQIEDEFLRRVAARDSLTEWLNYRESGLVPARHHRLLIEKLEAVERGDIKRLMINMPPGSAKSTYSSVEFPPWFIGRNKGAGILAASHNLDLAVVFGRRAKAIVAARDFTNVFEKSVSKDAAANEYFETTDGGMFKAAGVGVGIAGRRADLGLIDDPVGSREQAFSDRERKRAWDWYNYDFVPRLKPGARQIIIMTRWHDDDLGGRILKRDADQWTVIKIPMEADSLPDPVGRQIGERLWAEWFTPEMVSDAKKDTVLWNSLYQQNPIPEEGNFFKKEWFVEYDDSDLPTTLYKYGSSDYAVTDKGGDFTEHGIWGTDFDGNLWLLDWWYGQTSPDVWIEAKCDLIVKHSPMMWFGEAGPIRRSVEPFLLKRMETRRAYCHLEWLTSIHDKPTRARAFQAMASMGKVKIPKDKPWLAHVMTQLLQFPAGRQDDAVDVASLIGRGLEFVQSAAPPRQRAREQGFPSTSAWMA